MTAEEKVKSFLRFENTGNLKLSAVYQEFWGNGDDIEKEFIPDKNTGLGKLILSILKDNTNRNTIDADSGKIQCVPACNRSATDIWRIVKFYRPKTNIFSVMRILYRLSGSHIGTQYCGDVERRVFYIDSTDIYDTGTGELENDLDSVADEFDLEFKEWRAIGL